jgi:Synergist-CTERM protein sorting domain-containing protein
VEEQKFSDELGGSAYSLALVDNAGGGESDSSSGCDAGFTAFAALLFVLPLALRKKNR